MYYEEAWCFFRLLSSVLFVLADSPLRLETLPSVTFAFGMGGSAFGFLAGLPPEDHVWLGAVAHTVRNSVMAMGDWWRHDNAYYLMLFNTSHDTFWSSLIGFCNNSFGFHIEPTEPMISQYHEGHFRSSNPFALALHCLSFYCLYYRLFSLLYTWCAIAYMYNNQVAEEIC